MRGRFFLGIVALLGALSCRRASVPQRNALASCEGAAPDYRTRIEPLLRQYCMSCHTRDGSAGEEHDFSRFEVVRAQRQRVRAVLETSAMPPGGSPEPSDSERALVIRWACTGG